MYLWAPNTQGTDGLVAGSADVEQRPEQMRSFIYSLPDTGTILGVGVGVGVGLL